MSVRKRRQKRPNATPPRLVLDQDADYVASFQALCAVAILLRKQRRKEASLPLLLQKAALELRMGSFHAARDAAADARRIDTACPEAHWLHGMALLALCMRGLGLLDEGPGESPIDHGEQDAQPGDLLAEARLDILTCAKLARRDEEACSLADYLTTLLAARLPDRDLAKALAEAAGVRDFLPTERLEEV
ncbi:MAG: hypothetical protein LC620_01250 [Halobacteriales archaeon]|nr:hypothetical protein [Halobacteriales archaeon]